MNVVLYARCSTADQSVALQLDALREYAAVRRFTIVEEYLDEGVSGVGGRMPMPRKDSAASAPIIPPTMSAACTSTGDRALGI